MPAPAPQLLTFDVFGTLIDWRAGLTQDLAEHHVPLDEPRWESILADQEAAERRSFSSYADITTWSLVRRLGLPRPTAAAIARNLGRWPLFADSAAALRQLLARVPCVALTNSDREHGVQAQKQLGFPLAAWICAQDVRVYKPDPAFWRAAGERLHVSPGKHWWHVSAYADYDLATASALGLTTVLVRRPHCRPGAADLEADNLLKLAQRIAPT